LGTCSPPAECDLGEHRQFGLAEACGGRWAAVGASPWPELAVGVGEGVREVGAVGAMIGAREKIGTSTLRHASISRAVAPASLPLDRFAIRLEHVEDHQGRRPVVEWIHRKSAGIGHVRSSGAVSIHRREQIVAVRRSGSRVTSRRCVSADSTSLRTRRPSSRRRRPRVCRAGLRRSQRGETRPQHDKLGKAVPMILAIVGVSGSSSVTTRSARDRNASSNGVGEVRWSRRTARAADPMPRLDPEQQRVGGAVHVDRVRGEGRARSATAKLSTSSTSTMCAGDGGELRMCRSQL